MEDITFVSESGFEYQLAPDAKDDYDFFMAVRKANDPDASKFDQQAAYLDAFKALIGDEQDKALRKFLKERDGKVKTSAYFKEAMEVIANSGNKKK